MTNAKTNFEAAQKTYTDQLALYTPLYTAYEPYINGIIPARTHFSNTFSREFKNEENAWNVLYLSQDNPTLVTAPTNPSASSIASNLSNLEARKRSYWVAQLDYYSCSDAYQLDLTKSEIANEL